MKTTLEISDHLWKRAKRRARKKQVTLRSLVEEGLREVLRREEKPSRGKIELITFRGQGLQAPYDTAGWDNIREAIYETKTP